MTTIVYAVLRGIGVLFAGSVPWIAVLAPANLRFGRAVPWAVLPMAAYLWVYWSYIGGDRWSPVTADARRKCLRAHPLTTDLWVASLLAGLLGFAALFAFVAVMSRLASLPGSAPLTTPAGMPSATVFTLLVMSSIVAGVTEEAGFRGYMQGPIERRYGLAAGILINGTMFGLLHFPNHPAEVMTMLPYYIAVAAVYGGLTWAANSILPALVLHAGGDVWSIGRLWITGKPEWQLSQEPAALVSDTGVDARFLVSVAVFVTLTAATVWAYRGVYRLRAEQRHNAAPGNKSDRESVS